MGGGGYGGGGLEFDSIWLKKNPFAIRDLT